MKFLPTIINTSFDCTTKDPERSPVFVYSKLVEEVCELSDVLNGIASSEPLNGEVADVIISAVDLLYVVGFNSQQLHGCMTREELIDSVTHHLGVHQGVFDSDLVEEDWFRLMDRTPQLHMAMVNHYLGRITRLLNQPQRSEDELVALLSHLIKFTARMACAVGMANSQCVVATRIKVEHAIEHKVEKWRSKFGL